ncbi:hypothetical protein RSJ2_787 [Clostridium botulinum]|uniref:plantaricin C family lantibiotic n=1 Tax=Clostridium botulinum TaxID=1491 RepID=UPI00046771D4|nr:plantaricin C family lantibiotic [Clostridium botulinum]APQ99839.1 hypothetical protein RSJ2_787 [Clostridium botulinum]OPD23706.1 hypothetical protein AL710_05975 [Clostridium botulinum]OSA83045.1 hypothetical protein B2H84_04415 [Clostridium botulinum]
MNFSKRNPLLRNNMEEFNTIVGSLGEEIKEQNLEDINGGSTQLCASVKISAGVTLVVSKAVTWANDKVTAKYECGGVWSITAECQGC